MATAAPTSLRIPLALLTLANLSLLGLRLWTEQGWMSAAGSGIPIIDASSALIGYLVVILWLGKSTHPPLQKALGGAALLGLLGGGLLMADITLKAQVAMGELTLPNYSTVHKGLLVAAAALWGMAGWLGTGKSKNLGTAIAAGVWSGMTSALMASTLLLVRLVQNTPMPESSDAWHQYEGLAAADPSVTMVSNTLGTATWFLLVGLLVGAAVGTLCAQLRPQAQG